MNLIVISNGSRPELLRQTLRSLKENAAEASAHTYTLVLDGPESNCDDDVPAMGWTIIATPIISGSSASRNIGAASIPKHRRHNDTMFADDDIYATQGWDVKLAQLAEIAGGYRIRSGYSHPFNHTEPRFTHYDETWGEPLVISSTAMMMAWSTFDRVGPWDEPGGAGASEDYALCMRAKDLGYGFAVTEPQVILHCGLHDSTGKPIVGADQVMEKNRELMKLHNLKDVIFQ